MNKKIVYWVVGVVLVAAALFAFNMYLKGRMLGSEGVPVDLQGEVISLNNIIVPDQAPGVEVFVERALFKTGEKGGFVVIKNGVGGDIIGVSRYIAPGVTQNILVSLDGAKSSEVGNVLTASLYADDGDKVWDVTKDTEIAGNSGPLFVTFKIVAEEDLPGFETKL